MTHIPMVEVPEIVFGYVLGIVVGALRSFERNRKEGFREGFRAGSRWMWERWRENHGPTAHDWAYDKGEVIESPRPGRG